MPSTSFAVDRSPVFSRIAWSHRKSGSRSCCHLVGPSLSRFIIGGVNFFLLRW
jgi:hypothetical protein